MDKTAPDVRWKQRFNNFQRAYQSLSKAIELSTTRLAFKEGLLSNGEAWMDMIEARISSVFYAELTLFAKQFSTRAGT
jgi:hypothetical protein